MLSVYRDYMYSVPLCSPHLLQTTYYARACNSLSFQSTIVYRPEMLPVMDLWTEDAWTKTGENVNRSIMLTVRFNIYLDLCERDGFISNAASKWGRGVRGGVNGMLKGKFSRLPFYKIECSRGSSNKIPQHTL